MTGYTIADIQVRPVRSDNVWTWLSRGWSDVWSRPTISLGYGLFVTLLSYALIACLYYFDQVYLLLPLATAFMFGGPLLAVGLYEMSRRFDTGRPFIARNILGAFRRAPLQLAYMGLVLVLCAMLWIRIATLMFALFFGTDMPPLLDIFSSLFLTVNGVIFLTLGTATGAVLAFAAYAISVVSIPMILDRDVDFLTATIASLVVIRDNFWPMIVWGWVVAMLTAVAIALAFVGLIVIFPMIGHATWHCYRDVLGSSDTD